MFDAASGFARARSDLTAASRSRSFSTGRPSSPAGPPASLSNIRQQRHEPRPLDRRLDGALKRRAVSAPLPTEKLSLARAELFQRLHVLVIDIRRPRTPVRGAEPATALVGSRNAFLTQVSLTVRQVTRLRADSHRGETVKLQRMRGAVNTETARARFAPARYIGAGSVRSPAEWDEKFPF